MPQDNQPTKLGILKRHMACGEAIYQDDIEVDSKPPTINLDPEVEKRFDEEFPTRNDCTSDNTHDEYCQGCIQIIVEEPDEIKAFLAQEIARERERCIVLAKKDIKSLLKRRFNIEGKFYWKNILKNLTTTEEEKA